MEMIDEVSRDADYDEYASWWKDEDIEIWMSKRANKVFGIGVGVTE